MPKNKNKHMSDAAVHLINSLGGPPLPTGVPASALNVIIENIAASQAAPSTCRVASSLIVRRK